MRNRQLGVSLGALLVAGILLIALALLGLKLAPAYMEYFTIKKVVRDIAGSRAGATVAEIRKSFDARATIDGFESVKGGDLEITKEGNELVISAAYRREMPLVANVGLFVDFAVSSKDKSE